MSQSTVRSPDPEDGSDQAVERTDLLDSLATQALTRVAETFRDAHADLDGSVLELLHAAAIGKDLRACTELVRGLIVDGLTAERICDVYIPDTVRRMGEEWVSGDLPFSTVTIGTARLQGLLRELDLDFVSRPDRAAGAAGAIHVVIPPGADHTLGPLVLASQLRRKGFLVRLSIGETAEAVAEATANARFDAVFLSATIPRSVPLLIRTAVAVRAVKPGRLPIILGGAVVGREDGTRGGVGGSIDDITGDPDFAAIDHVTNDPEEAMRLCGLDTKR